MTDETFSSLVNRLTERHRVTLQRDDTTEYPEHDGLLHQLREAVFVGLLGGAGGGGFGSKPPIDAAARDLLTQIEEQATEALAQITGTPTPYGHAEDWVREWAAHIDSEKRVVVTARTTNINEQVYRQIEEYTARDLAAKWVSQVEEYFTPRRIREIKAPCPECGIQYLERHKDGQKIHVPAFNLHFKDDNATVDEAKCSNCGATWWPGSFLDVLAPLIGAKPLPEFTNNTPK